MSTSLQVPHQHINISTHQHINTSTHQRHTSHITAMSTSPQVPLPRWITHQHHTPTSHTNIIHQHITHHCPCHVDIAAGPSSTLNHRTKEHTKKSSPLLLKRHSLLWFCSHHRSKTIPSQQWCNAHTLYTYHSHTPLTHTPLTLTPLTHTPLTHTSRTLLTHTELTQNSHIHHPHITHTSLTHHTHITHTQLHTLKCI